MVTVVQSEVDQDRLVQRAVTLLGFAGLIPFWGVLVTWLMGGSLGFDTAMQWFRWFALYGAVIVSFMGGVRWGMSMFAPDTARNAVFGGLLGSVVPPLLAWAVVAPPGIIHVNGLGPLWQLGLLSLILLYQLFEDWRSGERGLFPGWYIRVRMLIVAGAVTPIWMTLLLVATRF
ncbi:MAG: DUF3429 domain-containing protein [Pseudomonadota bacterium]